MLATHGGAVQDLELRLEHVALTVARLHQQQLRRAARDAPATARLGHRAPTLLPAPGQQFVTPARWATQQRAQRRSYAREGGRGEDITFTATGTGCPWSSRRVPRRTSPKEPRSIALPSVRFSSGIRHRPDGSFDCAARVPRPPPAAGATPHLCRAEGFEARTAEKPSARAFGG